MKSWNHRHPNAVLAFFVLVWIVYAASTVAHAMKGDWLWAIIFFFAFMWADSRCRYWYNKTGDPE